MNLMLKLNLMGNQNKCSIPLVRLLDKTATLRLQLNNVHSSNVGFAVLSFSLSPFKVAPISTSVTTKEER